MQDRRMNTALGSTILEHLADLEKGVAELANTWRPEDPEYRADIYQQIMMNLSYSYFPYFYADAEHPDWSPLWNPAYRAQPNPDDIYYYTPIRGDLTYRVSGNRGTVARLILTTQHGKSWLVDEMSEIGGVNDLDDHDLEIGSDGEFEVIFSTKRPDGYTGNWAPISREANLMMVRSRSLDWANERDPVLS